MSNRPITQLGKVQQLQRKLWISAKQSRTRRFHALYDRIYRLDILQEAWRRVRANHGVCGIDGVTIELIEAEGAASFVMELQTLLKGGQYRPLAVKRVYIPKPNGKKRPLGIPVVRDRVVQMATKIVLEPIFEADFRDCSFGFRPKRSAVQALEKIRTLANSGSNYVLDADIKDYFVCINHEKLLEMMKQRISDRRVLKLIKQWLEAGVMESNGFRRSSMGIPQGGVISPLFSNIYLNYLDKKWESKYSDVGTLTRYADDFIIQCRSRSMVKEAVSKVQEIFLQLNLELASEKSRMVELAWGKEGFNFLGHYLRKVRSVKNPKYHYLNRWPSQESMKKIRSRIRGVTRYQSNAKGIWELVPELNSLLRGWSNYFKSGNSTRKFAQIESYLWQRLTLFQNRRRKRKYPHWEKEYNYEWFRSLGLYQLAGKIRYPNLVYANAYS